MQQNTSYHLYTHANGFENLFQIEDNYRYFLRRYEHFISPVADTYCYCLMPNHIHFLIRIKTEAEIESAFFRTSEVSQDLRGIDKRLAPEKRVSKQFSNLFNSYTKSYNKMYARMGSLFIPNFKREEITSDEYFTRVIHYIHANPVHHGFVKNIEDWPWSSYHALSTGESTSLLHPQPVWDWFGNREAFIRHHQQPIKPRTDLPDQRHGKLRQ